MLRLLAEECLRTGVERHIDKSLQESGRRTFKRSRGREPGANRDRGDDPGIKARDCEATALKTLHDTPHVVGPLREPRFHRLVEVERHRLPGGRANACLAAAVTGGSNDDIAVDRERQHKPVAVINVLADEIDAARCGSRESGIGAERCTEAYRRGGG